MRRALLWLVFAVLLSFRAFAHAVPVAAWLAPVLGLWLVRSDDRRRRWALLYVAHAASDLAMTSGDVVRLPLSARVALALAAGLAWSLPYLLDAFARTRVSGARLAFVFPAAVAGLDLLAARGPFGSWGSTAYTHAGNLPLSRA